MKLSQEIDFFLNKLAVYDRELLAKTVWNFWKDTAPRKTKRDPSKLKSIALKYRDAIDHIGSGKKDLDDKQWHKLMEMMKELEKAIKDSSNISGYAWLRWKIYKLARTFGRSHVPQPEDVYGYRLSDLKKGTPIYYQGKDGKHYGGVVSQTYDSKEIGGLIIKTVKDDEGVQISIGQLVAPDEVKGKSKVDKEIASLKKEHRKEESKKERILNKRKPVAEDIAKRLDDLDSRLGEGDSRHDKPEISEDLSTIFRHYRNHEFMTSHGEHDMYTPEFTGEGEVLKIVNREFSDLKKHIKSISAYNQEKGWFTVQINLK